MAVTQALRAAPFFVAAGMGLAVVQGLASPAEVAVRPKGTLLPKVLIAELNKQMDYVLAEKVLQILCYNSQIRIASGGTIPKKHHGGWTPYYVNPEVADSTLDVIATLSKIDADQVATCQNDLRADAQILVIQNIDEQQSTPPGVNKTPELDAKIKEAAGVVQQVGAALKSEQSK
jgi:hypothetical protein